MLSLGTAGWIILALDSVGEEQECWSATLIDPDGQQTRLAEGLSLAYAQGTAEDYARKVGAGGLVNPKAQWRQRTASDRQTWLLRKPHLPHQPDITAGAASDLIAMATLRRVA